MDNGRSERMEVGQRLGNVHHHVESNVKREHLRPVKEPRQTLVHQFHDDDRQAIPAVREDSEQLHNVRVSNPAQLLALVVEALQDEFRLLVQLLHPSREHGGLEFLDCTLEAVECA